MKFREIVNTFWISEIGLFTILRKIWACVSCCRNGRHFCSHRTKISNMLTIQSAIWSYSSEIMKIYGKKYYMVLLDRLNVEIGKKKLTNKRKSAVIVKNYLSRFAHSNYGIFQATKIWSRKKSLSGKKNDPKENIDYWNWGIFRNHKNIVL